MYQKSPSGLIVTDIGPELGHGLPADQRGPMDTPAYLRLISGRIGSPLGATSGSGEVISRFSGI